MKWLGVWGGALLVGGVLGGCGTANDETPMRGAAQRPANVQPVSDPEFERVNEEWRQQRLQELKQDDGWGSLVGLYWVKLNGHFIGSSPESGMRLSVGPPRMGLITRDSEGRIYFTPEQGMKLTYNGKPLTAQVRFQSDADPEPGTIGFDDGKGSLSLIKRGPQYGIRVRHADAAASFEFPQLDYWPADPAWRINARFVPSLPRTRIPVTNILGIVSQLPSPGAIEFERDGATHRLDAIGEPGGPLSIVFSDYTNGRESYASGRFLDVAAPSPDGMVEVDFNRAYNPPCAFTKYTTCLMPPENNRLEIPVPAGEKFVRNRPQ
jgi:uncharacterized protein (DUF1684 family)